MATAYSLGRPTRYPNGQDVRLARLAASPTVNIRGRLVDEWDAADAARRLIELDEARALNTAEEYAESHARLATVFSQRDGIALAQYCALHDQNDSDSDDGSVNIRSRPLDSQFGSDGNQYNPYAPHTSEEFMLQEIQAGRMNPEMMDMPRQRSNPAQSPLPENNTAPPFAHVHAASHATWMAPDPRPPYRQPLYDLGQMHVLSASLESSRSQLPYAESTASEDSGEEDCVGSAEHHIPENQHHISSQSSLDTALDPASHGQESLFGIQRPLTSTLDRQSPNEEFATGVPRQSRLASTGRERKRLAKRSLVVKLKTPFTQKSPQATLSPRRGRRGPPSSSTSNSALQPSRNSRRFNLRPQRSVGNVIVTEMGLASLEQSARTLTQSADAVQSPQRKRRRDAVSPRDASVESVTLPMSGSTHASPGHNRRASTGTYEPQRPSPLRNEVFVPSSVTRTPEETAALEVIRLRLASRMDRQANCVPSLPRPSSYLPPLIDVCTRRLVFTSELIPRSFGAQKRQTILTIFRTKAPYVPICIETAPGMPSMQYHLCIEKSPGRGSSYHAPLGPNGLGWPKDSLPLEVFHNIASHLSRDDLLQMRMVSVEFERKTSNIVFHTVVVPFRPEIYGMMIHDGPSLDTKIDIKGKGKAKEFYGPVEQDKTLHDGMKVFQAWGPHIKKFAMAFDVEEDQLTKPPVKGKFEFFSEFWGKYKWPHPYYSRFDFCAGLEKKADEFRCMSAALSNLQGVRELGVSIDSGLGYLCGPDISDHAQLFQEKPQIFGVSEMQRSSKLRERLNIWDGIVQSLGPTAATNHFIPGDTILANQMSLTPNEWGYYEVHFHVPASPRPEPWNKGHSRTRGPRVSFVDAHGARPDDRPLVFQGINLANGPYTSGAAEASAIGDLNTNDHTSFLGREKSPFHTAALIPNNLTTAQKEWLLETEWAQRAFLSSYCMALTDNSHTFQHVQSFTVAKLSSRYLSALQRKDFWQALPNLKTLTIKVSADWRNIVKADSGLVDAPDIRPSGAATHFYKLLVTCIADVPGIKSLSIGYFGGGEQQVGIFGRNRHILPAPLTDFSDHVAATSTNADILLLPHVEHFTLTNCWIAPPALKTFVAQMRAAKLRTLTLESVSLTAHSGVTDNMESDPLEHGVLRTPDGPPRRFGDPFVGDLFEQRGSAPDPRSDGFGWMVEPRRIGSWGNVIDAITPGPTVTLLRYAYQHLHDILEMRDPGPLERINFVSCGYVKLVNMKDFDQSFLGEVSNNPPQCLRKRALDLMPIMMNRNDDLLLGQIIPKLHGHDLEVLQTAFPMDLNRNEWTEWDNYEDGQPIGGSGRFSGNVKRLIYPNKS